MFDHRTAPPAFWGLALGTVVLAYVVSVVTLELQNREQNADHTAYRAARLCPARSPLAAQRQGACRLLLRARVERSYIAQLPRRVISHRVDLALPDGSRRTARGVDVDLHSRLRPGAAVQIELWKDRVVRLGNAGARGSRLHPTQQLPRTASRTSVVIVRWVLGVLLTPFALVFAIKLLTALRRARA